MTLDYIDTDDQLIPVGGEFNNPADTISVISEVVFTANHLTDTDKQNTTIHKLNTTRKSKQHKTQQNKTIMVQSPHTTLNQETRCAYSTTLPTPQWPYT